jgi:protein-S-isoprenylcysteine O-methyltransferase Ste14
MASASEVLFAVDVVVLMTLLVGTLWSIAFPAKRIWPPPGRRSWQHVLTWVCFYAVFGLNAALFVLDWNSWIFSSPLRLIVGVPLALVGGLLVSWGVATLGTRNTSGLKSGFVSSGPYRFTRNPQYLGDMILFVGLSIIANSPLLWITHALLILVFAATPLSEEPWLEEQYGEAYAEYRRATSRFL